MKFRGDHADSRRSVTGLPAVCDRALPVARTRSASKSDNVFVFMTGLFLWFVI